MRLWKIGSLFALLLIMMSSVGAALITQDPVLFEEGDTVFLEGDETAHIITGIEEDRYVMLDGGTVMSVEDFEDVFESAIVADDRAVFVDVE